MQICYKYESQEKKRHFSFLIRMKFVTSSPAHCLSDQFQHGEKFLVEPSRDKCEIKQGCPKALKNVCEESKQLHV